jgi:cytochrome d ubiquinol oxidase subunit II
MGPVWEANHVWLIFVVVVFFTAFPIAWAAYATALFVPLRWALVGIGLRGVAFVFRGYVGRTPSAVRWGAAFGAASLLTPLVLGACVGAISSGAIRMQNGQLAVTGSPWLSPISLAMALAGASLCAYLAAVFLCVETEGELQEDFRRRALLAGTIVVAGAALTVPFTFIEAPHLAHGLLSPRALPVVIVGTIAALTSGWSLRSRHYRLARLATIVQVAMVVLGWGLAQYPYVIYPDVTLDQAAAPRATMIFVLGSLPFGLAIVGPSFWWLFKVFKSETAHT